MLTRDLKYYGISEHEVIMKAIAKQQRWIIANPEKKEGISRRGITTTILYRRLSELGY